MSSDELIEQTDGGLTGKITKGLEGFLQRLNGKPNRKQRRARAAVERRAARRAFRAKLRGQ